MNTFISSFKLGVNESSSLQFLSLELGVLINPYSKLENCKLQLLITPNSELLIKPFMNRVHFYGHMP